MDKIDVAHWVLLIVAALCWWDSRRERRRSLENEAVMRGRRELDRVSFESVRGRP